HHAAPQHQELGRRRHVAARPVEPPLHVADTQPGHRLVERIEGGEAHDHAAGLAQLLVTAPDQRDHRLPGIAFEDAGGEPGGRRRLGPVSEPVDRRDEHAGPGRRDDTPVTGLDLPRQRERCGAPLDRVSQRFHRFMVTVVPLPSSEEISNSSISLRTPDRPSPRPPEVEYPSAMARDTSAIPEPSSRATTTMPCFAPSSALASSISPRLAYSTG